jgi:amidohydrolase
MDEKLKRELKDTVRKILPQVVSFRHELHLIPEPAFKEKKTAEFIRGRLAELDIETLPSITGTDVCAVISGTEGGGTTALRADIDALPITEKTGLAWSSQQEGFSHACGHDGHTAILLGTAEVLMRLRNEWRGKVLLIFQPGGENVAGAKRLIEGGLLAREPIPQSIYGLHGWPGLKEGCIASRPGAMMAGAEHFSLSVRGKGGHGAHPQLCVDPILTASRIVESLQSIVSRSIDPLEPAVVSICSIHGGTTGNIIPDEVFMKGTFRYFWPDLGSFIQRRIIDTAESECKAAGAESIYQVDSDYIPLINDESAVQRAGSAVSGILGEGSWNSDVAPTMGAEDFAFYLDKIPGAFLRLGLGENHPKLHTSGFDFNDMALGPGILALSAVALSGT